MYQFKLLLFILLTLLSGFRVQTTKNHLTKWIITKGCSLKVGGSTNVSKFSCVVTSYSKPDTLIFYKELTPQSIRMSGSLTLAVHSFDCHNQVMTGDLRKTLKAKEFPYLVIRFISLNKYPDMKEKSDWVRGVVAIQLAGVTKLFDIDYKTRQDGQNSLILTGKRQINFSDFNITPPSKIGGIIKTNDELNIEFNLCVTTFQKD